MYSKNEYDKLINKIIQKVLDELEVKTNKISCLNLQIADSLAKAAIKKSKEMGLNVVVTVMDKHGNLILLNRMEKSVLAAIEVSQKKAYTSVVLGIPSSQVLESGFEKIVETLEGKIVAFGGGIPIMYKNEILGAIGVSGGTSEEDIKIAEYAINAVST